MAIGDAPELKKPLTDSFADLKTISDALHKVDEGKMSDEDVVKAFRAIKQIKRVAAEKLTRPITHCALEFLKEQGYKADIISDTEIKVQIGYEIGATVGLGNLLGNELYIHLTKRFPEAHARYGGIIGGPEQIIKISYFI